MKSIQVAISKAENSAMLMRIELKLLVMIGVDSAVQSDVDSDEKWC